MHYFSVLTAVSVLSTCVSALTIGHDTRHLSFHQRKHVVRQEAKADADVVSYNVNTTQFSFEELSLNGRQAASGYWLDQMQHQGIAAYNSASYKVYRNVKDYGAKGDGVTDDTAAINMAIQDGNRCMKGCDSSTTTPAVVFFPAGTYLVTSPIIAIYYTQLIGDASNLPVLKAASTFAGMAVIDADPYGDDGSNWYTNQNNFFRAVRHFVIDLTSTPQGSGVHWQVAQATSLQNIRFEMGDTASQGIFMDNGSGGFMSDLVFNGGSVGVFLGNQQFTTRNFTFNGCKTAIVMNWNWGWTFKSLSINNCGLGINMTSSTNNSQNVGSVIVLDSSITNTPIGVQTFYSKASLPVSGGTLILDNVQTNNVPKVVDVLGGLSPLLGSSGALTIDSWAQGQSYAGSTGTDRTQTYLSHQRSKPAALLDSAGNILERSKPSYSDLPASSFVSARSAGAKGDGVTDDTAALQALITKTANTGKVVFIDHGVYLLSDTLSIPAGTKIVGEAWSVLMSTGSKFALESSPKCVIKVGTAGESGAVEMQDLIFQTQGPAPGAIVLEWNLADPAGQKGANAMWDVHVRIGGSAGTQLQSDKCVKNPTADGTKVNPECEAAFMLMHVGKTANIYMENVWGWTSDHDLDAADHQQITIFSGRGLWVESQQGVWLYGTAVEHNVFYQYQLTSAKNVFMGMIQTETPYYQSNPSVSLPFTASSAYKDPVFDCQTQPGQNNTCGKAWGLRVVDSSDILIYGAGLYSFFDNYDESCLTTNTCQDAMVSVEGTNSNFFLYGLNTLGATSMIKYDNKAAVPQKDNVNGFTSTIAMFTPV